MPAACQKKKITRLSAELFICFNNVLQIFAGMSNHEVADKIEKGYRMQKPSTNPPFPDSVYDIMLQCWHASDVDRPTFEDLSVSLVYINCTLVVL